MASLEGALNKGGGRGPIRNLRLMADRLHWTPTDTGWRQGEQRFTWDEADYKVKWEFALQLCKEALRQLKLDGQRRKDSVKSALNAALGGVWHEVRANSVFEVGEMCARCGEAVEDLEHIVTMIVHHCLAWAGLRPRSASLRQIAWLAACPEKAVMVLEDAVAILSSGVVGLATTLTLVKAFSALTWAVSEASSVVSRLQALKAGRRHAKGRHRDLECSALAALPAGVQIVWMRPHQTDRDAEEGRVDR
eukprot:5957088-Amphidinium_carterae.2